jgi:4'-phosphopantetheinyl transferase EntD
LKTPERRRLEWLLGRIAAKDALRDHLQRRFGLSVAPADVEILPTETGRPRAIGVWTRMVDSVPLVSISHVDGSAVAVAGDGMLGLGVDLERHGRMKPGMENVALTPREREMLEDFHGEERQAWSLRLWCAKEASAKATGCEFGPASHAFAIERIHAEQGTVWTRYSPPGERGVTLSASTEQDGEWVLATCIMNPRPEREEDFKP